MSILCLILSANKILDMNSSSPFTIEVGHAYTGSKRICPQINTLIPFGSDQTFWFNNVQRKKMEQVKIIKRLNRSFFQALTSATYVYRGTKIETADTETLTSFVKLVKTGHSDLNTGNSIADRKLSSLIQSQLQSGQLRILYKPYRQPLQIVLTSLVGRQEYRAGWIIFHAHSLNKLTWGIYVHHFSLNYLQGRLRKINNHQQPIVNTFTYK